MISPKTVTPDQPQVVPDDYDLAVQSAREAFARRYDEMDPRWSVTANAYRSGRFDEEFGVARAVEAVQIALAARPVLPVETPAEGLRGNRLPVARVIDDNQPGATAIVAIVCDPPTLNVGSLLYDRPLDHAADLVEAYRAGARDARAPAPLSGRDRSLREEPALAWLLSDGGDAPDVTLSNRVATEWLEIGYDVQPLVPLRLLLQARSALTEARAALAAVPSETAEMEGDKDHWWMSKIPRNGETEVEAAERVHHSPGYGGSFDDARCAVWDAMDFARGPGADRLAARANSSGEAGDE